MSILSDAETAAGVIVGGVDRAALFYNSVTHTWYYKKQDNTSGPIVEGVATFNGRAGAVVPLQADYDSFFLTQAEGDARYDLLGAAAAAQAASQPLDATLTALAGQNWVANSIPLGSGADAMAQLAIAANKFPARSSSGNVLAKDITDFGLSLVDDADASTARTTLGLGTAAVQNVGAFDAAGAAASAQAASQPLDATLTSLSGQNWVANALPIGSGADTVAQVTFAANTLPARSSSGNLVAKSVTDYAITTLFALADAAGLTAAINLVTTSLKGLMSTTDKRSMDELNRRVYRPADYAAGNTFDPTGAADSTTSFAACITALKAFNDRAVLEMPVGVFKVDNATFDLSAFTAPLGVIGRDRGICVIIPNQTTGDIFKLASSGDGVSLQNFSIFQTGGPNTTGAGIRTNGCDDVLINNVSFVNLFNDVLVDNNTIKCNITHTTHFQTNGNSSSVGILVSNGAAGDTYIGPDCVMSNTGATRRRASVEITESGHYEINQCNLTGSVQGILVDPGAGKIVAFGFHNEVLCDSCTTNGMTLAAGTATSTIKNIKSVNSWYSGTVSGGGAGVVTSGVAGGILNGVTHSNDRFLNNQTHGYQHGFGTDFRWEGCDMKGNSQAGNNANDGLNVAAAVSNFSVQGGKYGGSDTVPTAVNQRWGINILAGAGTSIRISPDDCSGNVTGPVSQNATGVVQMDRFVGVAPLSTIPAAGVTSVNTTEFLLMSLRVPAGSAFVGQTFDINLAGVSNGAGTLIFKIKAGANGSIADNQAWIHVATAAQVANQRAFLKGQLIVTSATTCKAEACGMANAVNISTTVAASATAAIVTTADWFIDVTVTVSASTFTGLMGSINPAH